MANASLPEEPANLTYVTANILNSLKSLAFPNLDTVSPLPPLALGIRLFFCLQSKIRAEVFKSPSLVLVSPYLTLTGALGHIFVLALLNLKFWPKNSIFQSLKWSASAPTLFQQLWGLFFGLEYNFVFNFSSHCFLIWSAPAFSYVSFF